MEINNNILYAFRDDFEEAMLVEYYTEATVEE